MNKERYIELRNLEENVNLGEEEFFKKYSDEFKEKFVYEEARVIRGFNSFVEKMQNVKANTMKRTIDLWKK